MSGQKHPRRHTEPEPSRPQAEDYGISTSGDGMLPWSRVSERMSAARNYWVGTTRPDGRPHVAPVWGVWFDETFYFGTGPRSRKGRNLAENPNVVVHLESGDDVVILEGVAEAIADPDLSLFERITDAYAAKYVNPETGEPFRPESAEGMFAVRPRVAFAWLERNFPRSATRWLFGGY